MFDADYSTRALADGIRPAGDYMTVEQACGDSLFERRGTNPIEGDSEYAENCF